MEVFEVKPPLFERQASIGSPRGGTKALYLLIVAVIIIIGGGFLIFLHFIVEYKSLSNAIVLFQKADEEKHCISKDCVSIASRMLSMMNEGANPCEDFYDFSCGGYELIKSVPFAHKSYSPAKETQFDLLFDIRKLMEGVSATEDSIILKKMKQFYDSCMNETERDKQQISTLKDWFSETEVFLEHLELGTRESTGSWRQLLSRLEEYRIHTVLEPTFKDSQYSPIERIRSSSGNYPPISEEHKSQVRDIWRPVVGDAVQEIEVVSSCKYDLEKLFEVMNNAPPEMSYTYIEWRMLVQLMPFLGSQFRSLHVNYISHLLGMDNAYRSKWQECSDVIREDFGLAALKGLLDKGYMKSYQINVINRTFLETKRNFAHASSYITDTNLRRTFLEKLNSMTLDTGYQKVINKRKVLDTVYRDLDIGDNYFNNIIALKKFKARHYLTRLWYGDPDNPTSLVSLDRNPLGSSASYDYVTNTANVDFGLFRPPLFWFLRNSPNYLKYGMNAILAREMSHAFDSTGILYDGDGNRIEEIFRPTEKKEKYESFTASLLQHILPINSSFLTDINNTERLNDFTADFWAFYVNYKALFMHVPNRKERTLPGVDLTKEQTYFVQTAQMYCELSTETTSGLGSKSLFSRKYRINNVASSIAEFKKAFRCSDERAMSPSLNSNFFLK